VANTYGNGDVFPFLSIRPRGAARRHRATILTHSYFENSAHHAGLDFAALAPPS
jgi:UDP:flavonoid glycosyltransferase YjiC (YdhE family)